MAERYTLSLERRLRPLRLAFLVHPGDRDGLLRALQINTVLWGGMFNAILPAFQKLPSKVKGPSSATAREVIAGYLETFAPDFVIPTEPALAGLVEFPKRRVLSIADVWDPGETPPVRRGLDATELYRELYKREFKFHRRHPTEVILPSVDEPDMSLFSALCFGQFPSDPTAAYIRQAYLDAFDSAEVAVDATNLFEVLRSEALYPLRLGSALTEAYVHGWRREPVLFYMDAGATLDVMDYWNLRALGWPVIPVPRQWAASLVQHCEAVVVEHHRRSQQSPHLLPHADLIASRSISREEVEAFRRSFGRPALEALALSPSYPRLWDAWNRGRDQFPLPELEAEKNEREVEVVEDEISMQMLAPEFADPLGGVGVTPRWVNVVTVHDFGRRSETAHVLPSRLESWSNVVDWHFSDSWLTREGIIVACDGIERTIR